VDTFLIQGASGAGSLEFFERTPADPRLPVERFKVRLTHQDLSATGRVYTGHTRAHPAPLFAQMAANWKGWQGTILWESPEGDLRLLCGRDRAGHISIRVELRSGPSEHDWAVQATVMAEAGQLEDLSHEAALFFGQSGSA
jgi:hypothetical protein